MQPSGRLRHPEKKIKFFCETDVAFLCSKCVIQHTGVGHIIKEYHVDIEQIKSDFSDVMKQYKVLLNDSESAKGCYEQVDRKLGDMCNSQINKLDLTFKSLTRMLE